jgi:flagellar hook-associated protein 2
MASLSLSGLASGFDWKSLVDQLMELERTPITRIEKEQATNTARATALKDLGTRLTTLQNAAKALKSATLFSSRTASSSGSSWSVTAAAGTPTGSYQISVSQLATATRREGATDITGGLNATDDVSGLTIGTLRTAVAVTAGTFSVNGQKITVATTDSLEDVFAAIAAATGDDVTASYDATTDKVTLTSAGGNPIALGAANDTSNFLTVFKLANNNAASVTSSGTLGAARTTATLANAGLRTAITAVDGSGNGSFTINGQTIAYNVNTDTLGGILKRINAAGAGVTASYDSANDRVVLANNVTGDLAISVSEAAGGLLGALGLTTGATVVRGNNALFTLDGGPTITSTSNTLDASVHGIEGLSVTVDSASSQTLTVAADTAGMRAKIDAFVAAYNAVQTYIDDKTRITSANGKVTTSVLSSNREVQEWSRSLRSLAFGSITGLSGSITSLNALGLDFDSAGTLSVKDSTALNQILATRGADVEAFFTTASTGFAAKFDSLLTSLVKNTDDAQTRLNQTNTDLDRQIADIERRLDQQRELLTNSFIAMETAQSKIQQQSTALTNAFSSKSSSSS